MNSLGKQRTLAMMTGFERYTKKTRRAIFLEEMEQVVPWAKLCGLIEPHYPKPGNGDSPLRDEGARGRGQQDQAHSHGGGDGGPRLRGSDLARSVAWGRNASVGRRCLSRADRSDPRVRTASARFYPAALSL